MPLTVEGVQEVSLQDVTPLEGAIPVILVGGVTVNPRFTDTADRSGTFLESHAEGQAVPGTAFEAIPYRYHRFWMLQNVSDSPMWYNLMGGTSAGPDKVGSYYLPPKGPPVRMEHVRCAVSLYSDTDGARWAASIDYTGDGDG